MFSFDRASEELEALLYAATVRGIVMYHALHLKTLVSYGDLASATKVMPKGGQLAQALTRIAEDDHAAGRPLSTAVVVNDQSKIPGSGFFKQCYELGLDFEDTSAGRLLFWRKILDQMEVRPDLSPLAEILGADYDGEEIRTLEGFWRAPGSDWQPPESVMARIQELTPAELAEIKDNPPVPLPVDRTVSAVKNFEAIAQKRGYFYVPPQDLRVGDTVLMSNRGHTDTLLVESVATYTRPPSESTVVTKEGVTLLETALPTTEIHWVANGRNFISPATGMHLKVKRNAEFRIEPSKTPLNIGPVHTQIVASGLPSGSPEQKPGSGLPG